MAKLKFGNNIKVEAKLDPIPVIGPNTSVFIPSNFGQDTVAIQQMIKDAIDAIPKVEIEKIDLSEFQSKVDSINRQCIECIGQNTAKRDKIEKDLNDLILEVKNHKHEQLPPEIKEVIKIQDNSPKIMQHCKEMIHISEVSLLVKISNLQKQNKQQKIINYSLIGITIITILLHLL